MNLTFVEASVFTKLITAIIDDNEFRKFQNELGKAPDRWPVVPGSGGLRKARMRVGRKGKRGGARVLYLYLPSHGMVYFYMVYLKGEIEDVPKAKMKEIREDVQEIKSYYQET